MASYVSSYEPDASTGTRQHGTRTCPRTSASCFVSLTGPVSTGGHTVFAKRTRGLIAPSAVHAATKAARCVSRVRFVG